MFICNLLLPLNLLSLGVIFKTLTIANCASLFGLPMVTPKANIHIEATVTDKSDENRRWSVSEDLVGISVLHGKIHVSRETQSFDIFYHHLYDDRRLIIADYECNQMGTDPDFWSLMIPGTRTSLLNVLLLTGPSIIFRLSDPSLKWVEIEEDVDGIKMKRMDTTLNGTLRIKIYFKDNKTSDMEKAVRINFGGYLEVPGMTFISKLQDDLVLNIISVTRIDKNLDVNVQPTTGIGCPTYFQSDQEFPKLFTRQLHFTATETLTSDLNRTKMVSNVEVYVDVNKKLIRFGIENDYSINDFNLGVSFVFNGSKCSIEPFNRYIPGLIGGQLNVNELTWMNGQFKYVGKTIYEPRARGIFDTWESIEYGRFIDGLKYDKVVTTQYMASLSDPNGPKSMSVNYIPVAMVRVAYKKDVTGKYFIAESRRRDISEFQQAVTKTQYQNLFDIADCFNKDERMTLMFDIRSEEYGYACNTGTQYAEENMYEFKENFKSILTKQVSPLRIASINLDFYGDRISARVDFLEKPPLEKSFHSKDVKVKVGVNLLTNFDGVLAKSIDECLKTQIAGKYFRTILYCPSSNGLCVDIDDPNKLYDNDDEYMDCLQYNFPLNNQYRLSREVELNDLRKTLLRTENNMMITLRCDNCSTPAKTYRYRITNVLDYTLFGQTLDKKPTFMEVQKSSKLDSRDKQVHLVSGSIHNFGDCYSTCVSPINSDCVAFSYCSNGDTHECLTSNALFTPNATIPFANCTTYGQNFILEYQKAPQKQFFDTSEDTFTFQSWSADDCAAKCSQSGYCFSFQYCFNNQCTFTRSSYTIKRVKQDPYCDVYTPKKSKEFMVTGTTLVNTVILNESKLNLEQCAALCYNWKAGNESCKSFNFCPRGRLESTCQLAHYSVGDPNVRTFPSQYCFNFELIKTSPPHKRAHSVFLPKDEDMSNATTSISLAFLIIGLALGIAATSIYHTVHNRHKYRVTSADQESDI